MLLHRWRLNSANILQWAHKFVIGFNPSFDSRRPPLLFSSISFFLYFVFVDLRFTFDLRVRGGCRNLMYSQFAWFGCAACNWLTDISCLCSRAMCRRTVLLRVNVRVQNGHGTRMPWWRCRMWARRLVS